MQAVNRAKGQDGPARSVGRGFVGALPSPLRRAARRLEGFVRREERLRAGRPARPLGRGTALALGFFAAATLYGAHLAGTFGTVASHAAARAGLGLGDVAITGLAETAPEDVYAAIGLLERPSLVGIDLYRARERLLALPWIAEARLRTVYPGKLAVDVVERKAFAVWQRDDVLTIVERTGRPITRFGIADLLSDRWQVLPNVVGEGAAEHAAELLPLAARHEALVERVRAYVRVSDRRWDVVFDNDVRLLLPAEGIGQALATFAALQNEHDILARPVLAADLRDPSRMTLRLTAEAAAEREKAVAAHLKAMRRAEPKRGQRL